jgi:hypothetical protein
VPDFVEVFRDGDRPLDGDERVRAASSCTVMAAWPVRRRLRPFTVVSPVLKRIVPSRSSAYQIGAT